MLKSTTFKNLVMEKKSLISIGYYVNSISIDSRTYFTDILRQTGDGSVFELEFGKRNSDTDGEEEENEVESDEYNEVSVSSSTTGVSINNAAFENCVAKTGNGGAVSIKIQTTKADVSMKSTTFKKCGAYSGELPTTESRMNTFVEMRN